MERRILLSGLLQATSVGRRVNGVYYGWWLVGVSGAIMSLSVVPLFYGMTAWLPVFERTFGWSRGQLSLGFAFARVNGSVVGPLTGYLTDRLGPKRMVLVGMLILGSGLVMLSQIQNLWQFYLAFIVASAGASLGSWLPMMTVLNNWFLKKRAMAMSGALAISSLAAILLVPVLAWAISPDNFGPDRWRTVAMGIGIAVIVLAFPLSRLVRRRPEDYGFRPDGDPRGPELISAPAEVGSSAPDEVGLTLRQIFRTRAFWMISVGDACTTSVMVSVTVHLGPLLNVDRGLSLETVGLVVSAYMIVATIFQLVGGYMGDRMSMPVLLFAFSSIQSAAVVVLLRTEDLAMAFVFAVLMGVGFGARAPLSMAIRGAYFGRRNFGRLIGMSQIPMNVLNLAMPLFAGYMFDARQSYNIPFGVLAGVGMVGAFLFLMLGKTRPATSGRPDPAPSWTGPDRYSR